MIKHLRNKMRWLIYNLRIFRWMKMVSLFLKKKLSSNSISMVSLFLRKTLKKKMIIIRILILISSLEYHQQTKRKITCVIYVWDLKAEELIYWLNVVYAKYLCTRSVTLETWRTIILLLKTKETIGGVNAVLSLTHSR